MHLPMGRLTYTYKITTVSAQEAIREMFANVSKFLLQRQTQRQQQQQTEQQRLESFEGNSSVLSSVLSAPVSHKGEASLTK